MAETLLKGGLDGLIFKEAFSMGGQLEPGYFKMFSGTFTLLFVLGLFRVEDFF